MSAAEADQPPGSGLAERGTTQNARRNAARRVPLVVFADPVFRGTLEDVGAAFTAEGRPEVRFEFADSPALVERLLAGEAGEVLVASDERSVDALVRAGKVVEGTRSVFLWDGLVVVTPPGPGFALRDLMALPRLRFDKLVLVDPARSSSGRDAQALLAGSRDADGSLLDRVRTRIETVGEASLALSAVAETPGRIAIVHRSEARASDATVALELDPVSLPQPIRYAAAAIEGPPRAALATRFVEFLRGPAARAIFERRGFVLPPATPPSPPVPPREAPTPR